MKFLTFIQENLDALVKEWEAFTKTLPPASQTPPEIAPSHHIRQMLLDIIRHLQARAAAVEAVGVAVSEGTARTASAAAGTAAAHGALRHAAGFALEQVVSEFCRLRMSVFALWRDCRVPRDQAASIEEISSFNEAVDKALGEAIQGYAKAVATSRDMFLAVLGHDLRGPLHSIQVAAALLASPGLPEPTRVQTAMRIVRGSKTMNSLITDLLEFTARRMGRQIPIARSECDLRQACEEALDAIKAADPECAFVQSVSGDLHIRADGARLRQVLANLLNNAVQHGDCDAPVLLKACGDKDAIVLAVANSGRPIPREALRTIFDPLVQIPSTSAEVDWRSKSSLGLGLFIAREIVLGHHGTIDVESSPEAGTVFTVRLPRVIPSEGSSDPA